MQYDRWMIGKESAWSIYTEQHGIDEDEDGEHSSLRRACGRMALGPVLDNPRVFADLAEW